MFGLITLSRQIPWPDEKKRRPPRDNLRPGEAIGKLRAKPEEAGVAGAVSTSMGSSRKSYCVTFLLRAGDAI